MKKSDIRNSFNEICEFKDIKNLKGLAYCIFQNDDDRVQIPYFDEVYGEIIKLLSKMELAKNIEFVLSEEYMKMRNIVKVNYYDAVDMGISTEMAIEGHAYETMTVLLQKILDEITNRTTHATIDLNIPNTRWSTEKFTILSGYLKPDRKYIASPSVAAALRSVKHNVDIKNGDQLLSPFYHNQSVVFVDMFSTVDYLMEVPNKITVHLDPVIKMAVKPRETSFDSMVVEATISLEIGFEPTGCINEIVGLNSWVENAEVSKN